MVLVPCRECGKELSTEAASCPHCGAPALTSPSPSAPTPSAPAPPKPTRWVGAVVTGVLLAAVGAAAYVGYLALAKKESAGIPGARPPIAIRIGDGSPQQIQPGGYLNYTVNVPDRTCTLSGRVEGVSGGNRDFEAFILDDDNFRNWSTRHQAQGISSGNVVVWTPTTTIRGPAVYHVVVSNAFSVVSPKVVAIQATVECP